MKLIKGYNITQTERKHIQFMLDNNMSSGGTKLKSYQLTKIDSNTYDIIIHSKYTDIIGDVAKWHKSFITIKL